MIGGGFAATLTAPKRYTKLGRRTQTVEYLSGPFHGMRDTLDPSNAQPDLALLLENCYPADATRNEAVVGRPGFQQAGAQLGAVGSRTGQLVTQFTKLDGTEYTVAIVGGQGIYTFNWATRAWTNVVTTANLTTAGVTLSTTAMVFAVTFANKLVISDGTNKPFTWDGTSGASGLTLLSNASVAYGQPWVYYGKLFFIKNASRTTLIWSEENDATIGYDTAPYSNTWTLGQTDQNALYAGYGTNDAMYYFRARSVGVVQGAVNSEFTANAVHDSASSNVGTTSPVATVYHEGRLYFIDAELRPHMIVPGGAGAIPLWNDASETVGGLDRNYAATVQGVYHPGVKLVLFAVTELSQTTPSMIFAINPYTSPPNFACIYLRGTFNLQRIGIVKNADGVPTLMHLDTSGYAYDHGLPSGSIWSDGLNAGTAAIRHIVSAPFLGNDTAFEKKWTRCDMLFHAPSNMTNLSIRYLTPRGVSTAQTFTITSSLSRYDVAIWDTDLWASTSIEQHAAAGWSGFGRWIQPTIQHETAGEQFGLEMIKVTGVAVSDAPGVP